MVAGILLETDGCSWQRKERKNRLLDISKRSRLRQSDYKFQIFGVRMGCGGAIVMFI